MAEKYVQLSPYGMTVSNDGLRPLLLLKDQSGEHVLPVPLNPIEAGITLSQSQKMQIMGSPHRVSEVILKSLHIEVVRCVFSETKMGEQWVLLEIKNHPMGVSSYSLRASEAMCFCLHLEVPIFASLNYILKAKVDQAEATEKNLALLKNPQVLQRTHQYLM